MSRLRERLREDLRALPVLYVTVGVTALVLVYLFVALVRPEWF